MASNRETNTGFDKLFVMNVPHILEKIFLSLDYESFKKCHDVSNTWKVKLYYKHDKEFARIDIFREDLTKKSYVIAMDLRFLSYSVYGSLS